MQNKRGLDLGLPRPKSLAGNRKPLNARGESVGWAEGAEQDIQVRVQAEISPGWQKFVLPRHRGNNRPSRTRIGKDGKGRRR